MILRLPNAFMKWCKILGQIVDLWCLYLLCQLLDGIYIGR